ncbi:hypothetical protein Q3G72_023350 [Acer saccharum]|nr:hypothetical protein Q3G72_023350 [Acer saccharum]
MLQLINVTLGRVRDVYLSPRNSSRKSLYAFVRFETLEEAIKVARLTNGMHVYGWLIVSKLASFGWNKRRSVEGSWYQNEPAYREKETKGGTTVQTNNGTKSFAEALRSNKVMKGPQISDESVKKGQGLGNMKELSMFWNSHQREECWLRRCAMGTLKSFSNVECVNERLISRGFHFTSHFMGSKRVLWVFESEIDKEGFINNRFFWDDRFVSMKNWSDSSDSNTRMVWINCTGIPLCYWSSDFFVKLGWVIREPLLVDEETLCRRRLDMGRILILVKQEEVVSAKVKVEVGKGSFSVVVKKEDKKIDGQWIEQYLGLRKIDIQDMQNCNQVCEGWEEEDDQAVGGKLGSRWQPREEFCKAQEDRVWQHRHQARSRKTAGMRKKETDMSSLDVSEGDRAFSNIPRKNLHVKGKKKWVPKPRQTVQHEGYGKLIIRENQSQRKGRVSDSTSTSEEEGFISDFKKWRGECSKTKIQKEGGDGQGHGLDSRNPNQDFQEISFGRSPSLDGPLREFWRTLKRKLGQLILLGFSKWFLEANPWRALLKNIWII